MDTLWTAEQVAKILNCKPSSVYAWAKEGKIPAFKLNGCLRFGSIEIEEWVRSNKIKPMETDKSVRRILRSARRLDIDAIVRKSIDSVKGKSYTSPQGKPDPNQALKKGGSCGAV